MSKATQMIVVNDEGTETTCDILFTHEHNGKNYVIFEFLDSKEISGAVYVPGKTEDEGFFEDIETDEEWDLLDKLLQEYFDKLELEADSE